MIKTLDKKTLTTYEIKGKQIKNFLKEGAIIIDVRSPQEYKEGHIKKAICIPEYEIERKIQNKIKNKEQKIVLYCDSGARSKKARQKLENLGYKSVLNL